MKTYQKSLFSDDTMCLYGSLCESICESFRQLFCVLLRALSWALCLWLDKQLSSRWFVSCPSPRVCKGEIRLSFIRWFVNWTSEPAPHSPDLPPITLGWQYGHRVWMLSINLYQHKSIENARQPLKIKMRALNLYVDLLLRNIRADPFTESGSLM